MSRSPRRIYLPRHVNDHSPHGYPPRDPVNRLWHRIETVSFLACLFLFSRAFVSPVGRGSIQNNHLLLNDTHRVATLLHELSGRSDANNNNNMVLMTTLPDPLEPYHQDHKSKDPLNWYFPSVTNTTDLLYGISKSDPYTKNPNSPSKKNDQDSVLRFDALPRQEYTTSINSKSPESRNSQTVDHPPSLSINSRIVRGDVAVSRAMPRQLDGEFNRAASPSIPPLYLPASREIKSPPDVRFSFPDDETPFFSDEDGEIFALKIWIDKKEHLRAKLGKVEYCQASSGIRCLSVEK